MEFTNKRKADEDQQEQPDKRNKDEQDYQALMRITNKRKADENQRSIEDWEDFAKDLKAGAERRAEENKKAKVWDDMDDDAMMEAIGAVGFSE